MGKTHNSGLCNGVGSSPQISLEQNNYNDKIEKLIDEDNKAFDPSNFSYDESKTKYNDYLLNLNHKQGGSKAKFLKDVLGYEKGDSKILHEAISNAIKGKIPDNIEATEYGVKHNYKVKLKAKDGSDHTANVTIVIQKDNGKVMWRLITITPDKKDK